MFLSFLNGNPSLDTLNASAIKRRLLFCVLLLQVLFNETPSGNFSPVIDSVCLCWSRQSKQSPGTNPICEVRALVEYRCPATVFPPAYFLFPILLLYFVFVFPRKPLPRKPQTPTLSLTLTFFNRAFNPHRAAKHQPEGR